MHRHRLIAALLAVLLVGAAVAPGAVTAGHDDDDGRLSSALDAASNGFAKLRGAAAGFIDRLLSDPADRNATESADAVQAYYNGNASDFEQWTSARVDASTDRDVFALTFERDGETVTKYLVADVNNGSYENSSVVDSTNRAVDEECTITGMAAANAPDEVERFHTEYVQPGQDLDGKYVGELAGKYKRDVSCTFMD